jgi:TRAP-type transport system periplasmic protein
MKTPRLVYRLGLNQPLGSPTEKRVAQMAQAINREAEGRFRLDAYPEGRLGLDPQMFADLRAGKLELYLSGALFDALAPTSALALLPFAFRTTQAVFAALDGALGDKIRGELSGHGIHALPRAWQNGFHHLTTNRRPIRDAGDFAGLKIRTPGGAIAADFFKTLGAIPGFVPFNRMYDALKAGAFDGQSDPLGVVLSLRLYEVQRYLSLSGHWWSGFTLLANAEAWHALPAAIREIVERNAEKFALLQRTDVERINAAGASELERRGMILNSVDTASIRARLGDLYARWREKAGPEAWRLLQSYADGLGG